MSDELRHGQRWRTPCGTVYTVDRGDTPGTWDILRDDAPAAGRGMQQLDVIVFMNQRGARSIQEETASTDRGDPS